MKAIQTMLKFPRKLVPTTALSYLPQISHTFFFLLTFCLVSGSLFPAHAQILQWTHTTPINAQITSPVTLIASPDLSSTGINARPNLPQNKEIDVLPLINQTAQRYGLDPKLVQAVIHVESAYHPNALSKKGAIGLMQVMPDTGKRFGKTALYRIQDNLEAGSAYLQWLLQHFNGRLDLALAGYNAGEKAVSQYGNTIPPYQETQQYVNKVLNNYALLQKPFTNGTQIQNVMINPAYITQQQNEQSPEVKIANTRSVLRSSIPSALTPVSYQGNTSIPNNQIKNHKPLLEQVVTVFTSGYSKTNEDTDYAAQGWGK